MVSHFVDLWMGAGGETLLQALEDLFLHKSSKYIVQNTLRPLQHWQHVVLNTMCYFAGYFPVVLEALPEGTCVHAHCPVFQVLMHLNMLLQPLLPAASTSA